MHIVYAFKSIFFAPHHRATTAGGAEGENPC